MSTTRLIGFLSLGASLLFFRLPILAAASDYEDYEKARDNLQKWRAEYRKTYDTNKQKLDKLEREAGNQDKLNQKGKEVYKAGIKGLISEMRGKKIGTVDNAMDGTTSLVELVDLSGKNLDANVELLSGVGEELQKGMADAQQNMKALDTVITAYTAKMTTMRNASWNEFLKKIVDAQQKATAAEQRKQDRERPPGGANSGSSQGPSKGPSDGRGPRAPAPKEPGRPEPVTKEPKQSAPKEPKRPEPKEPKRPQPKEPRTFDLTPP